MCVLRRSKVYTPEYVYRLKAAVDAHLPGAEFVCLSDSTLDGVDVIQLRYGWPGWWSKMELFRPDIQGDILYLDLDTVITGDMSDIAAVGKDAFLRDFYRGGEKVGSGVMWLSESSRSEVWKAWKPNANRMMIHYRRGGDQAFLEPFYVKKAVRFQDVVPGQIVSYKAHCKRRLPDGARVVCYHGVPKPHSTGWATHG